jgi:hypothetical protein
VQRRDQHTGGRIQRPAAGDADRRDLAPRSVERLPPESEEPPKPVLRSARGLGRRDDEPLDASVVVDDPGGELRAADVEPERGRSYPLRP